MSANTDPSSWLIAAGTVTYVVLTAGLLALAFRQARRDEVSLISALSDRWGRAQGDWVKAMLIARGPTAYYNIASPSETHRYATLLSELEECRTAGPNAAGWLDVHQVLANRSREYEEAAGATIELLAGIGLLILRGRLSPSGAYAVLGPQLARNAGSLRMLLPGSNSDGRQGSGLAWNVRNWATYRPGVVRRVLILVDVVWAEAVRLGDLAPYELAAAADAKRAGTGKRNRNRLRREISRVSPMARGRAWKLSRLLRRAEWRHRGRGLGLDRARVTEGQQPWLQGIMPE